MQNIPNARGDPRSRFHNALYAGDVEGRIETLRDVGMCKGVSSRGFALTVVPFNQGSKQDAKALID